jgi:hypothetical protein
MDASLYIDKNKKKIEDVVITKKIEFMETLSVISFCLGAATILYWVVETLKTHKFDLTDLNLFFWPSAILLGIAYFSNKWSDSELDKLYNKESV